MTLATGDASFRYRYDEIEDLPFHIYPDSNINNTIDPDPTGAVDYQHDLIYEKLHAIDPELEELYRSLGKPGSGLIVHGASGYDYRSRAKFYYVSKLTEEASRFDKLDFHVHTLPHQVIQAVRGCQADNALMISCIAFGNATGYASIRKRVPFARIFNLRPHKNPLHELLVRLLLASAGVDSSSLPTASESKVFEGHDRMLSTVEARMPLPEVGLPSKRLRSRGSGVPNFFDVAWPTNESLLQSGGFIGFFHDFYHMSVKRPYQKAPTFEFIRVLLNPKGVASRRSMPKCLIACSSYRTQDRLLNALISIRIKQGMMRSPIPHWSPLHELMNCISAVYQVMFDQIEDFATRRFSHLQDMKFHGRVHPWRSKFQYLHHLEDQIEKSRNHLETSITQLEAWTNAKVHGVRLVSVPGTRWAIRIRRLRRDASHLSKLLKELDDRRIALHSTLKEQLDQNSGTRSLILTVLASIYVPLAFVSSYFGMNAKEMTNGGLVSTTTFWEVSIPVMVASIIIPIVFSGLLIRLSTKALRSAYKLWLHHGVRIEIGIFLALNVASAVRGGLTLFWIVWTTNLLYVLESLPSLPLFFLMMLWRVRLFRDDRAAWRSRTQEETRTPATAVTATASQATRNPSEVDINSIVPTTDSEQAHNVQMNTIAAPSQVSVHSSTGTVSAASERRSTVTNPSFLEFLINSSPFWIRLGGIALGSTFLVLDILYHPKSRPSLSFYHSFGLWFSLLGGIEEHFALSASLLFFGFGRWKRPHNWWHQLATRLRRDERSESNETRSRDGSRAESERASAV